MKRYLCILFLLFGYFIFRGDCVLASGVDRLVEAVYPGAGDFSTAYTYDASGNMMRDLNKGISNITYNLLNLPGEITFSDGRKVKYIYTADGTKVRTTYYDATGSQTLQVDYCGNYILHNGVVDRILTTSGYIKNDTVYSYVKDYQGNVRCVVRQDGTLVESNEYYPYGGLLSATASVQPYKYGTKELDRMHGLDLYDSQARWYDSLLGRITTMDPKAEKYYSFSPYTWCAGNPVKFVDPDGCFVVSKTFEQKYPRTAYYLKNGIGNVYNVKRVREALIKYSERGKDVLKTDLQYGKGPKINAVKLDKYFGYFDEKESKTTINVDSDMLERYENAEGLEREVLMFLISVTILHEYVHYGDSIDGKDQDGEEGNDFEIKAYGEIINFNEAEKLVKRYINKMKNEKIQNDM